MKNIILIGLLIVGMSLSALDHGLISGFEVGYNLSKGILAEDGTSILLEDLSDSLYIQLKTGYRIENFRIMGTYTNTLLAIELDSYRPVQDRFRIDINYTWNGFTFGAFHWCDHPVTTQNDTREMSVNMSQRSLYVSYYREF